MTTNNENIQVIEKVISLHKREHSLSYIDRGLDLDSISSSIKNKDPLLNEIKFQETIRQYKEGSTLLDISKVVGLNRATISRYVKIAGLPRRGKECSHW